MNACELVTFITALACAIDKCYTEEEIELFAAIFSQLGDTLATISTRNGMCNSRTTEKEEKSEQTERVSSENHMDCEVLE